MKRESGYYWVRDGVNWYPARWESEPQTWLVCGVEDEYADYEFDEIDERRIERIN